MQNIHRVNRIAWTVLTASGLAAGLMTGLFLGMPLSRIANAMIVTAAVTSCVGLVLGACQAFGLRRLLGAPMWWAVASMIGVGIGLALGVVLVEQAGILMTGVRPNIARLTMVMRLVSLSVVGATTGVFLGAAQAIVLRIHAVKAKRWTLISAASLAAAFAASSLVVDLLQMRFASVAGVITFVFAAGLAYGWLTSIRIARAV